MLLYSDSVHDYVRTNGYERERSGWEEGLEEEKEVRGGRRFQLGRTVAAFWSESGNIEY